MNNNEQNNIFRWSILLVVFLGLVGGLVGLLLTGNDEPSISIPPPSLHNALLKLRNQLEWPGVTVQKAADNLESPEQISRFVRDGVLYVSYSGSWKGPGGTLRTRTGNTADQSRLLASLLKEQGFRTRLRKASYPEGKTPHPGNGFHRTYPALETVKKIISSMGHNQHIEPPKLKSFTGINSKVDRAKKELIPLLEASGLILSPDRQVSNNYRNDPYAQEKEWVWVQYRRKEEEKWKSMDPVFPDLPRPDNETPYRPEPVHVDVVLEAEDRKQRSTPVVRWSGPAGKIMGHQLTVSHLPAGSPNRMLNTKDPGQFRVWNAILQVGPEVRRQGAFTPTGQVLRLNKNQIWLNGAPTYVWNEEKRIDAFAPPLQRVSVASVDPSEFPRVRVTLSVDTEQKPRWHHRHLRVRPPNKGNTTSNNELPTRIESGYMNDRPVVLVLDVSPSMFGKMGHPEQIDKARKALKSLLNNLRPKQKVSLVTFAKTPELVFEPEPVREIRDKMLEFITRSLKSRDSTHIPEAVGESVDVGTSPSTIVFLTDGLDSRKYTLYRLQKKENRTEEDEKRIKELKALFEKKENRQVKILARSKHRFIGVGIGDVEDDFLSRLSDASGGTFYQLDTDSDLEPLYDRLGSTLSGRLIFSFDDHDAAHLKPGSRRHVKLRMKGASKPIDINYTVPDVPASAAALKLKIRLKHGNSKKVFRRTLQTFPKDFDPWQLISSHELVLSRAPLPSRMKLARKIDTLLDLYHLKKMTKTGKNPKKFSSQRGMSPHMADHANRWFSGVRAVGPDDHRMIGKWPLVLLQSRKMKRDTDRIKKKTTLDVHSPGFSFHKNTSAEKLFLAGLRMDAVEAELIGAQSTTKKLLAEKDTLEIYRNADRVPGYPEHGHNAIERATENLGRVVASPELPGRALVVYQSGEVRPVLFGSPGAKGASVEEIAAKFKRIRNILQMIGAAGSGALAGMKHPAGAPLTAICTYYDRVVRMYCYASVMLGFVREGMEKGEFDPRKAERRARKLCDLKGGPQSFRRQAAASIIMGYAGGWAESVAGEGASSFVNKAAGAVGSSYRTGPAFDFIVGAAASHYDPIPGAGTNFMVNTGSAVTE